VVAKALSVQMSHFYLKYSWILNYALKCMLNNSLSVRQRDLSI
jgi:hypothetical protein